MPRSNMLRLAAAFTLACMGGTRCTRAKRLGLPPQFSAEDDGGWPPRVAKVLVHFDWTGRRSALNFTAGMHAGVSTLQLYSGRRQEIQVTRAGGEESCEFAHLSEAMLPPISTEDFTRSNGAGVCGALVAPPFQEWTHDTGLGERTVACLRMPEQLPLAIVRQFDARPSAAAYWAAEDDEGFPPAAAYEPGAGTPDWQPLMTWRFHTLTLAPPPESAFATPAALAAGQCVKRRAGFPPHHLLAGLLRI